MMLTIKNWKFQDKGFSRSAKKLKISKPMNYEWQKSTFYVWMMKP